MLAWLKELNVKGLGFVQQKCSKHHATIGNHCDIVSQYLGVSKICLDRI